MLLYSEKNRIIIQPNLKQGGGGARAHVANTTPSLCVHDGAMKWKEMPFTTFFSSDPPQFDDLPVFFSNDQNTRKMKWLKQVANG